MTGSQVLHLVDAISVALMLIVPVWAVIRLRHVGATLAATYGWGLGALTMPVLHMNDGGFWVMNLFFWLVFSWPILFVYAMLIYGIILLARAIARKISRLPPVDAYERQPRQSWMKQLVPWWRQLYPLERIGIMLCLLYPCTLVGVSMMG